MGLGCAGEGVNRSWAPGVLRRPRRRGASGFRPESLARRRPRRVSTAAVPAGRAGCRASPGRSRPGGGPRAAVRASALPSPCSPVPSGRGAAWRLRGARNTPLSPPPRLPRRCARAVRPVASPGRAPGAERLPGARVLRAAPRGAGAQSLQNRGAHLRGSGPRAWLAVATGPQTSQNRRSPPGLRRRQRQRRGGVLSCRRDASSWRRGRGARFQKLGLQ